MQEDFAGAAGWRGRGRGKRGGACGLRVLRLSTLTEVAPAGRGNDAGPGRPAPNLRGERIPRPDGAGRGETARGPHWPGLGTPARAGLPWSFTARRTTRGSRRTESYEETVDPKSGPVAGTGGNVRRPGAGGRVARATGPPQRARRAPRHAGQTDRHRHLGTNPSARARRGPGGVAGQAGRGRPPA